jgi:hypothetical protein
VLARRASPRVPLTLALALAASFGAACLPLGEPPRGRHEVSGRDLTDVGFIQPAPGAGALLFTRRDEAPRSSFCDTTASLFTVDEAPAPEGAATERPLAEHVARLQPLDVQGATASPYGLRTDARGRVFLSWQPQTDAVTLDGVTGCPTDRRVLARIDPATGARTELGRISGALLPSDAVQSADRTRVAFQRLEGSGLGAISEIDVRDLDDHELKLGGDLPTFIGDDLYALAPGWTLTRFDADGAATTLAADVGRFSLVPETGTTLLALDPGPLGHPPPPPRLLDLKTSSVTELPSTSDNVLLLGVSRTGRYVMLIERAFMTSTNRLTLVDRETGTRESRTWPLGEYWWWRADADEFWSDGGTVLSRWTPGAETRTTAISQGYSYLSDDGRFWLHTVGAATEARPVTDPDAPAYVINPPGTRTQMPRSLPDGRLLVQVDVAQSYRYDLYVVDVLARTARPLASGGNVAAVGATRVLAFLRWSPNSDSGDLSLVDLETGNVSLLAENAYRYALEPPPPGGDPLAPGLRLAAVVRSRIASPYDGLWVSTLP